MGSVSLHQDPTELPPPPPPKGRPMSASTLTLHFQTPDSETRPEALGGQCSDAATSVDRGPGSGQKAPLTSNLGQQRSP